MVKIGQLELKGFPLLLAPMEDISDPPFRSVCKEKGVDLMYTEFVSSEGLIRDVIKSTEKLDIFEKERPIGIQIFGSDINAMCEAVKVAEQVKPDLIDINYGCPVKKVVRKGAGAGLLLDIPKMVKMTAGIVKATHLPVTVKTRLGWDEKTKNIVEIAERLQDAGIKAITIHGRTRAQMYKGEADWTLIGQTKNNPRMKIPVFGNGDVDSPQKAKLMKDRYGVDGIMIGRASVGNPWIFREIKHFFKTGQLLPCPVFQERLATCRTHLYRSIEWKGEQSGILEMRKHYANYFKGLPNIKPYRTKLVTADSLPAIEAILNKLSEHYCSDKAEYLPL